MRGAYYGRWDVPVFDPPSVTLHLRYVRCEYWPYYFHGGDPLEAKKFRIDEFPEGDDYWRVDWIDDIHNNPSAKSDHLISVFLTRLQPQDDGTLLPFDLKLLEKEHRRSAEVSTGLLPMIWVGSVWQDGRRIDKKVVPDRFDGMIDTGLAKTIQFSAHANPGRSSRLVPPFAYPLGVKAWEKAQHAPLYAIPFDGDPAGVIIPALEVIRFYYIYSTSSAQTLFWGRYDLLYEDARVDASQNPPDVTLTLRWFSNDGDAWQLARHIVSPEANSRAKRVHDMVALNRIPGSQPKLLPSLFPFDGKTRIRAEGAWIKGEDGRARFFALRLKKCSHPMPYGEVTIRRIERPKDDTVEEPLVLGQPSWPTGEEANDPPFRHDQEPDRNIRRLMLGAVEDRFDDLHARSLKVIRIPGEPRKYDVWYTESEPKGGLGTSEGTYGSSDLAPAEINTNARSRGGDASSVSFQNFIYALNYLRDQGLGVTTIDVEDGEPKFMGPANGVAGEIVCSFARMGRPRGEWTTISGADQKSRGIIIASVTHNGSYAYIMELERDLGKKSEDYGVLVLASPQFAKLRNQTLLDIVTACPIYGGWPPKGDHERTFLRTSAPHTRSKSEQGSCSMRGAKDNGLDLRLGRNIYSALRRIKFVS